jgi:FkbM family methyltransferase
MRFRLEIQFHQEETMPESIRRLAASLTAADRLGNPVHVLRRRMFADRRKVMTIVDKATGITCLSNVGSYHIFGETWYSRVYDVPGLPIRAGDVVFDIGANQGFFTCYAASKGAVVYAFEPVPESYDRLVRNVKRNGFADRVTAVQCAVSNKDGATEMLVSESKGGGDSTINFDYARRAAVPTTESITVECRSFSKILDDFAIPSIRLCKIDAEGSELALLSTLTADHRARIQGFAMEYHPQAYDLQLLLKLLLGWGAYQVCLMNERPNVGNILHLISNKALESWFEDEKERWSATPRTGALDGSRASVEVFAVVKS